MPVHNSSRVRGSGGDIPIVGIFWGKGVAVQWKVAGGRIRVTAPSRKTSILAHPGAQYSRILACMAYPCSDLEWLCITPPLL